MGTLAIYSLYNQLQRIQRRDAMRLYLAVLCCCYITMLAPVCAGDDVLFGEDSVQEETEFETDMGSDMGTGMGSDPARITVGSDPADITRMWDSDSRVSGSVGPKKPHPDAKAIQAKDAVVIKEKDEKIKVLRHQMLQHKGGAKQPKHAINQMISSSLRTKTSKAPTRSVVWGVNKLDGIVYRAGIAGHWKHIGGKLKQVSVSGHNVWGVNRNDDIFHRNGVGGRWKHIAGKLKQMHVSGNHVWGVNRNDDIFYRGGVGGRWKHIAGKLKHVSVSGNTVWGVNRNDDIFHRGGVGGRWKHIAGKLKQISISGNTVWGANRNDDIFHRNGVGGRWKHIAGKLKHVGVSKK